MELVSELLEGILSAVNLVGSAVGTIFVAMNLVSTFITGSVTFLLGLAAYIPFWIYIVFLAMIVVSVVFLVVGR